MTKKHKELIAKWKARPYSWSQHSAFDWDKEQWFQGYVLGFKQEATGPMEFGNKVGDSLGTPNQMIAMPTLPHKEYEVRAKLEDIELIGFFDFYDDRIPEIQENKTSSNPNKWTQESVDNHGQLDFYLTLLFLPHKGGCSDKRKDKCVRGCVNGALLPRKSIRPDKVQIKLYYIPVQETQDFSMEIVPGAKVSVFPTKRTTKDVLKFMVEIKRRRKQMEAYARKRLSESAVRETLLRSV